MVNRILIILAFLMVGLTSPSYAQKSLPAIKMENEFFKELQISFNKGTEIKTVRLLDEARSKYPDVFLTWFLSAKHEIKTKDYFKAYEYILRARDIQNSSELDYMSVEVFKNLGEFQELESTYQRIIESHPFDFGTLHDYLQYLHESKQNEKYALAVRQALKNQLFPRNYRNYHYTIILQLIRSGKIKSLDASEWERLKP